MNTEDFYKEIDSLLEEYDIIYSMKDIEEITLENILQGLHDVFVSRITAPFVFLGLIAAVIIFTSFIKGLNQTVIKSEISDIVGILTATAVLIQPLLSLYSEISETITRCGEFINLFVPIFAGICALSGNVSVLGTYNMTVLGMSQIIIWISDNYLIPVLTVITALAITGGIYNNTFSESFVRLLSKAVIWIITVSTGIFVGFLTLKNVIGVSADNFAAKTVKFIISGCVPVIGGAVSDAYSALKGSVSILKSSAGMAGIIASLLIFIPPVAEAAAFRIVLQIGGFIADMFSVNTIGRLLKSLESGLSVSLSIMICFTLMFIISTAILI